MGVAPAGFQLEVESKKGRLRIDEEVLDAREELRQQPVVGVGGTEEEQGPGRGSLSEPCKPRKTVTCHGVGVVEPVYHQASLRGSWATAAEAPEHSWAGGGAPCKPRKTVFLFPSSVASDSCLE